MMGLPLALNLSQVLPFAMFNALRGSLVLPESKQVLSCGKNVNINEGGHVMNDDHLLLGIRVHWGHGKSEEALLHQHGITLGHRLS